MFDRTYRETDQVLVTSPAMGEALIERGVSNDRISTFFNWQDRKELGRFLAEAHRDDPSLHVVYGGNLGAAQGLETLIRAVSLTNSNVKLTLVGDGTELERLRALADQIAQDDVEFLDRMSSDEFEALAARFDATVVSLAKDPVFTMTLPGKLVGALAMGFPIIAAGDGDMRRLVEVSGAGWTAPADDAEALAGAMMLARAAGVEGRRRAAERGLAYYKSQMAPEIGARVLNQALEAAVKGVQQ